MPWMRSFVRKKWARITTKIGDAALSMPATELSRRSNAHAVSTFGSQPLTVPSTSAGTHRSFDRCFARRVARMAIHRSTAARRPRAAVIVKAGTVGTATFIRRNALPHISDMSPSSTHTVVCGVNRWRCCAARCDMRDSLGVVNHNGDGRPPGGERPATGQIPPSREQLDGVQNSGEFADALRVVSNEER